MQSSDRGGMSRVRQYLLASQDMLRRSGISRLAGWSWCTQPCNGAKSRGQVSATASPAHRDRAQPPLPRSPPAISVSALPRLPPPPSSRPPFGLTSLQHHGVVATAAATLSTQDGRGVGSGVGGSDPRSRRVHSPVGLGRGLDAHAGFHGLGPHLNAGAWHAGA